MKYRKILGSMLEEGLKLAVVGALLAVAAPAIATLIGPGILGASTFAHAMGTSVAWTSAFFGAFGAIKAAVDPAMKALAGDKEEHHKKGVIIKMVMGGPEQERSQHQGVTVNHHHTVNNDIGVMAVDASTTKNVGVDAREKHVDKSENNVLVAVEADASRTKNVGIDNSEHIKLVDKSENVALVDIDAQEKTKLVNKGDIALNTMFPATSITDAETRRALLLGPAASQAIN